MNISLWSIDHASTRSSWLQRSVAKLAKQRWFAAIGRRLAPIDMRLYRATAGRLTIMGLQGAAMPRTLLLTTTGRRSGRPRSTPVMFLRDGRRLVVTSESFGQARPAAWPLNLIADPHATVQLGGQSFPCRALPASEEQVAHYWPRFLEIWPAHGSYQQRSGVRHMFILEPTPCTGA
jgi:deazaflavin-dependent oxidoreductase (nitroreductase family)